LRKQTLSPAEVILVLDNRKDLVDFYESRIPKGVRVILNKGAGLSNARNAGVKAASGVIVAFIDDDAYADENWLRNLIVNYDDSNVLCVGGLIKPIWETGRPPWFPEELDWVVGCSYRGLPETRSIIRNPIGCNMSFVRDVFGKVGYFREGIGRLRGKPLACEEAELSIRILEGIPNSKIMHEPLAIVYHKVPKSRATIRYLIERSFYQGYSKAISARGSAYRSKSYSTEITYLDYMLRNAFPRRLKKVSNLETSSQSLALLVSTSSVLAGYLIGKSTLSRC